MAQVQMKKRLAVEEYTTPSPIVVETDSSLAQVAELMEEYGIRHVPVIKNGKPVGVISDRDLKVVANFEDMKRFTAEDIMSTDPYMVSSDTSLEEVVLQMSQNKMGSALVVYPEDLSLGIFTSTDALNALVELLRSRDEAIATERIFIKQESFRGGYG